MYVCMCMHVHVCMCVGMRLDAYMRSAAGTAKGGAGFVVVVVRHPCRWFVVGTGHLAMPRPPGELACLVTLLYHPSPSKPCCGSAHSVCMYVACCVNTLPPPNTASMLSGSTSLAKSLLHGSYPERVSFDSRSNASMFQFPWQKSLATNYVPGNL